MKTKEYTLTYDGETRYYNLLPEEEILKKIKELDPLEIVKAAGANHIFDYRDGIAGVCLETGDLVDDYQERGTCYPYPPETIYVEIFRINSTDTGIYQNDPEDLLPYDQAMKFYEFFEELEEAGEDLDRTEALERFIIEEKMDTSLEQLVDSFIEQNYYNDIEDLLDFREIEYRLAMIFCDGLLTQTPTILRRVE